MTGRFQIERGVSAKADTPLLLFSDCLQLGKHLIDFLLRDIPPCIKKHVLQRHIARTRKHRAAHHHREFPAQKRTRLWICKDLAHRDLIVADVYKRQAASW